MESIIPVNNNNDEKLDSIIRDMVDRISKCGQACVTRDIVNRAEAVIIADKFREKGYHHEIRMHTNDSGLVFFYCLNVSKKPIRTNDARYAWSEYVR